MTEADVRACLAADSSALRKLHSRSPGGVRCPAGAAALAFADILDSRFCAAHSAALAGPAGLATSAVARLAAEMTGHASGSPSVDELADALTVLTPTELEQHCWPAALVAEAAMAAGRLALAESVSRRLWEGIDERVDCTVFAGQTLTRALLFQGRLDEALRVGETAAARARAADLAVLELVLDATLAYVFALRYDRPSLDSRIARIELLVPQIPRSYFSGGALVLSAYALAAAGETHRAATMMLRAGGGPDLGLLQNVDRVYGYELLVTAALGEGDASAARDWAGRAESVPTGIDGMAAAARRRSSARLAAAEGDPALGAALAEQAEQLATGATGHLDATRAALIAGSALLRDVATSPAAGHTLRTAGDRASDMGAVALAVLARRDLRSIGLRLTGSEQTSMTRRERQVADLVITGMTDARIGRVLGISERTVQLHVGRVLRALGVQSRTGVAAALRPRPPRPAVQRDLLTPRQQQVADLVARGYPNEGVAATLQVSVKTVEKHVSDVYRRLQIQSRAALAAAWGIEPQPPESARR